MLNRRKMKMLNDTLEEELRVMLCDQKEEINNCLLYTSDAADE